MLRLYEHAGWEKAHDPHMWWTFDARETSPKTCPLCLSLHMTQYRGDRIDEAFPYHIHMRVNAIKAYVHPNCRCVLRWAGSTVGVWKVPMGWLKHRPKLPKIPKTVAGRPVEDVLSALQRVHRKQIVRHAPEIYREKLLK